MRAKKLSPDQQPGLRTGAAAQPSAPEAPAPETETETEPESSSWSAIRAAKSLGSKALAVADHAMSKATSEGNVSLVAKELRLTQQLQVPGLSSAQLSALLGQMRALMGAEPLDKLDPLPAVCAPALEKTRAKGATLWDPAKETVGRWADDKAKGPPSDPVNMYVHGSLDEIVRAFQRGGWSIAHEEGPEGASQYAKDITSFSKSWFAAQVKRGWVDPDHYHAVNRMPLSTLFLKGQPQLVGMQANNHPVTGRDHFRIFATGKVDAAGRNVYAIAASRDAGLKLDPTSRATAFTAHFTEEAADRERTFTVETLKAGGTPLQVNSLKQTFPPGPVGGLSSRDGRVYDIILGSPLSGR